MPAFAFAGIKDIKLIEGVQRRATMLVDGIGNWSYDERYLGYAFRYKKS